MNKPKYLKGSLGEKYGLETEALHDAFESMFSKRPTSYWLHAIANMHQDKKLPASNKKKLAAEVAKIRATAYETLL